MCWLRTASFWWLHATTFTSIDRNVAQLPSDLVRYRLTRLGVHFQKPGPASNP